MDLVFCTEARLVRRSSGLVYSIDGGLTNNLWQRYLCKFNHVYVMARVLSDDDCPINDKYLASSERVSFIDLPYYLGPIQYLKTRRKLNKIVANSLMPDCVYICRVPGEIGTLVADHLRRCKIPYGVEVVGDPWDVFAPGAVRHPFRVFFRYRGTYDLKRTVVRAAAALYVTENQLQKRYPVNNSVFSISASDVQISSRNLPSSEKVLYKKEKYNLLSVGSWEQMYKAPDVVLEALALLKDRGVYCRLTWLGEGKNKGEMQKLASALHITNDVNFKGNVSREEVDEELKNSDLFLLVSRTEGLPRALIEAMAMGLPCIGTQVGGIPELLNKQMLIRAGDSLALANKIEFLLTHIDMANKEANRNYEFAKNYYDSVLQQRRESFYQYLISIVK